ncbi:MAG: orotidine-5'-phosphate decarboxylase [Spirochaetia bacterium]|jgi:uridine monophosphate synthetase
MDGQSFFSRLERSSRDNDSLLCVGLDPGPEVPTAGLFAMNCRVIDAAHPFACAFKPNSAFYEARGVSGWEILKKTIDCVHEHGLPVVLDAKRGDIASTADAYAQAAFDVLGADAVTVNPLLGSDSVESFARRAEKGLFLLCHTTNPGARDLQELAVDGRPLFELIAAAAARWNTRGNIGLVVGATYPAPLAAVRAMAPGMWILLPGIGAQGGDLEKSLAAGLDAEGSRVLVNVSRTVYQASDPGATAREYRDRINKARRGSTAPRPGSAPAAPASLIDKVAIGLHDLGAVKLGQFTLKSGKVSPIYIDLRLLVSDPSLMALVARALAGLIARLRFDRIAAIPYGGLPIGQAVSLAAQRPLIYPRREAKEYGTKKLIEGIFKPGETALVLDDLITTGASKVEALTPLKDAGLKVTDVVVLVDREQGGKEELAASGLTLHAALTVSQLLDALVRHGRITAAVRSDVRSALGIG